MEFVVETLMFSSDVDICLDILKENGIDANVKPNNSLFDIVVFDELSLKRAKKLI